MQFKNLRIGVLMFRLKQIRIICCACSGTIEHKLFVIIHEGTSLHKERSAGPAEIFLMTWRVPLSLFLKVMPAPVAVLHWKQLVVIIIWNSNSIPS